MVERVDEVVGEVVEKVVEDDATTAWTHKQIWKNKKDILSNLIRIHFYQSIVQSK
jgi:hypothetical protein